MNNLKPASKFLSLVLRHSPGTIGISMNENRWVLVKELIEKTGKTAHILSKKIAGGSGWQWCLAML